MKRHSIHIIGFVLLVFFFTGGDSTDAKMKLRMREAPAPYRSYDEMRYDRKDRHYFNDVITRNPQDANRWQMYRRENYRNPEPHSRTFKEKQSTVSKILHWFFD